MAEQPDTVIVGLDLQSNSARQTIGACNKLGLQTILVLEGEKPDVVQGNLLVDYLLGAEVVFAPTREAQRAALDEQAARVREAGGRPHILNDNPMFDVASALAYLETTLELLEQMAAEGAQPTALYMSSSGKGQAGLVLGKRLTNAGHAVHGITATDEFHVPSRTAAIANETLAVLGLDTRVGEDEIENDPGFVGAGYGIPTEACVEAVKLFARTEGVILDPIYTGKAAAGMIAHIRAGPLRQGRRAGVRAHRRHAGDLHLEHAVPSSLTAAWWLSLTKQRSCARAARIARLSPNGRAIAACAAFAEDDRLDRAGQENGAGCPTNRRMSPGSRLVRFACSRRASSFSRVKRLFASGTAHVSC